MNEDPGLGVGNLLGLRVIKGLVFREKIADRNPRLAGLPRSDRAWSFGPFVVPRPPLALGRHISTYVANPSLIAAGTSAEADCRVENARVERELMGRLVDQREQVDAGRVCSQHLPFRPKIEDHQAIGVPVVMAAGGLTGIGRPSSARYEALSLRAMTVIRRWAARP